MDIKDFHMDRLKQIDEVVDLFFEPLLSKLNITLSNGTEILCPDASGQVLREVQELAINALGAYDHDHIRFMIESINQAPSYKNVKLIFKDALIKIGE